MKTSKPTWQHVLHNCCAFARKVGGGDYYIWALRLIAEAWGKERQGGIDIRGLVSGVMILEYSWNDIFYQDGLFDQRELEKCIQKHLPVLSKLQERDLYPTDPSEVREATSLLFGDFLEALKRRSGVRGPVAVGKCLHLLRPRFFPLWDTKIAMAAGHYWGTPVETTAAAGCYASFMEFTKDLIRHVTHDLAKELGVSPEQANDVFFEKYRKIVGEEARWKTMLKLMDEYLYVEYTRPEWKSDPYAE